MVKNARVRNVPSQLKTIEAWIPDNCFPMTLLVHLIILSPSNTGILEMMGPMA
jgi:hypothetical protein